MALLTRPPVAAPAADAGVEVLIKEARHLRRRRWILGVVAVLLAAALSVLGLLLASGGSGGHRRASIARTPPPASGAAAIGRVLTSSSLGAGTTVVAGSMLTATQGFALAGSPLSASGYLVFTRDGGVRWIIRGVAPFSMRRYFFVPSVRFLSPTLGYVESGVTNAVYVTHDGGRTWRRLLVPGHRGAFGPSYVTSPTPTFAVVHKDLFLVGQQCGRTLCRTLVATFAVGAARARAIAAPPAAPVWYGTPVFLSSPTSGLLALSEGSWWRHPAALLESRSATTWTRATSPCHGRTQVGSIVPLRDGSWLTQCFLGEGMTQGLSQMWRSGDQGSAWSEVAVGNMGTAVRTFGNLPDAAAALGSSNDGRLVWGLLGSAAGGVMLSLDGGASWRYLNQHTGEGWDSLAPAGPHGAVVFTPGASLWTTDGTHFLVRRLLAHG